METNPPYKGSLDPFEDICDQLEAMGVAYCLAVGMQGGVCTYVWGNASKFGSDGVFYMTRAIRHDMEKHAKRAEEDGI